MKIFKLGTNTNNSIKQNIDVVFTNIIATMLGIIFLGFAIKNFITAEYLLGFILLANSLSYILVFVFNYLQKGRASIGVLLSLITFHLFLGMIMFGPNQRSEGIFLAILLFAVLVLKTGKFKNLFLILMIVCYFAVYYSTQYFDAVYAHKVTFGSNMVIMAISLLCIIILSYVWNRHNLNVQNKNEELIQDVKNKNERLEKFIFLASHDLKTPLRTIVSFNELIKIDIAKQEYKDLDTYADLSVNAGKKMYKLIDDIVNYAKIGEHDQSFEKVDLRLKLNEIKEELSVDFPNSKIINEVNGEIIGVEIQLHSLFKNLIENGLKYNESNRPTILISSKIVGKSLVIFIEDNGIGIPERQRTYVFGMFKRLHGDNTYEGTGVGLALCKQIIDLHKGKIAIQSAPNGGTIFQLAFRRIQV